MLPARCLPSPRSGCGSAFASLSTQANLRSNLLPRLFRKIPPTPAIFWMCGKQGTLSTCVFGCVASKGVTGAFSGCVVNTRVSEKGRCLPMEERCWMRGVGVLLCGRGISIVMGPPKQPVDLSASPIANSLSSSIGSCYLDPLADAEKTPARTKPGGRNGPVNLYNWERSFDSLRSLGTAILIG